MVRQITTGADEGDVYNTVDKFHRVQNRLEKKDINSYKTVDDLKSSVEKIGKSKSEERNEVKSGAEKVYEDDRFLMLNIRTHEAVMLYGKGTKWCLTEKN
jgi:hypothetical protein